MDGDGKMKETKKIDDITRKFASSRDITEDEADYIFIMKVIHRGYLDGKAWKPFYRTGFYHYDFTGLSNSLTGWYKLVCSKLRSGYRGNFISTIPGQIFFAGSRNYDLAEEYAQEAAKTAEEIKFVSTRTNVLSKDFIGNNPTRYGLCTPGDFKDVRYIKSLMARMEGISLEEADNIYSLLKFHQSARQAFRLAHITGRDNIFDVFAEWYQRAGKLIEKSPGNFVHTIPHEICNLYQAKVPIRQCLKLLPYEPVDATIPKNDISIRDIPFDTWIVPYENFVRCTSKRYGFFARNGFNFNDWRFLTSCSDEDFFDVEKFFSGHMPYRGRMIVYKLKVMTGMGIFPARVDRTDKRILVKKEDYDNASIIVNIPEKEIIKRADSYIRYTRDEAYIDVITKLADEGIAKKEYLKEDNWLEMDR
jgi:hypothetical protein